MLVRFLSIDLLGAAGPAAQVPSRVGNELEAVLGETHVNGSAVMAPSTNENLGSDSTSNSGILPANLSSEGLEGLVNIGSAIVLIMIMILVGGLFLCFKRRLRGSRSSGSTFKVRAASLGRGQHREADMEESNELDELVASGYRDENKGKGKEIFGLGDDEDGEERHR